MIATEKRPLKIDKPAESEEVVCVKPKVILVLSNTKDLRRIIQLSFEEIAGWQVFVADLDSPDLTLITITQPDVILLDTNLPNSGELVMLRKIQNYPNISPIPIVLLTERIFSCDRKFYDSLGIVAAIAKPCDMVTLATLISQRLNWNWT
ncbi:response regulator containing a CheY-like receiver domain and an HD-GYP domain [Xenococcus sp. PCC 7305]|uniref:response regulator n=1 Tax=Xenococcus sp. PCC 7305 TaxID=102125 RepID=UPI0002AC1E8A|nr:response regulator [Xenococcus sp. PCC 7305]ELS03969.1 response regulator containing a CheY-like receiver domain and an HD-GYP domain [Xenococcus sp. PCC 7305]